MLQLCFAENGALGKRFPTRLFRAVIRRQIRIVFRIPLFDIDAVENAAELERQTAQHAIEPGAARGRLDFAGVIRRNGGDLISEDDAALHQIDFAEVLDRIRRPVAAV